MQLTLAKAEDHHRALALFKYAYEDMGRTIDDARLEAGLSAVLPGQTQAAVYLIGPANAPVGIMNVCFGFNLPQNNMMATIDVIYIRNAVRQRGLGSWAISTLMQTLKQHGVSEVRLDGSTTDPVIAKLAQAAGLKPMAFGGGFASRVW